MPSRNQIRARLQHKKQQTQVEADKPQNEPWRVGWEARHPRIFDFLMALLLLAMLAMPLIPFTLNKLSR
jgi:hypothetical protein